MSVKLNKQETNRRVLIDNRSTHLVKDINVNETRVVEEKQKTGQDMRTSERARTEQLKVAAIKSEPRLVKPISKENIAVEVLLFFNYPGLIHINVLHQMRASIVN